MEEDKKLRLFAVDSYVSLLQGEPDKLPQRFLQVISWVSAVYLYCSYNSSIIAWTQSRGRKGNTKVGLKHALAITLHLAGIKNNSKYKRR